MRLRICGAIGLMLCGALASAQTERPAVIPPETPLDEIVCEAYSNVDTCWSLGLGFLKSDPARAAKIMEISCAFGAQKAGCYEAGKIYLLSRPHVNYGLAYKMFEAACYGQRNVGQGPYACKYLGHIVQLGLGRPADANAAHDILIRACFTHNDLTTDPEGCDLLAKSYLFGFDTARVGRSPEAIPLAFMAYARGCEDFAPGLCADGAALLRAYQGNARLMTFLEDCDAGMVARDGEERTCAEVLARARFVPRGFAGGRAYEFRKAFLRFWRVQFTIREPRAAGGG